MIACLFALTVTKKSGSRSKTNGPNKVTASLTRYQESDGNGNIFYLDRHQPSCAQGAMTSFILERKNRNSDNVRYANTCVNSSAITGKKQVRYTNFNATDGAKSVQFLDRHNVNCPAGTLIQNFRLQRKSGDNKKIRYQYTCVSAETLCCKSYTNGATDAGDFQIFYLDRQRIGHQNNKNWGLNQFKLSVKYGPKNMWGNPKDNKIYYSYEMCKLKDMDAQAAVEQSKKILKASEDELAKAATELEAAKNALVAAQAKIQQLTLAKANADNKLQSAQAAPGLTC